MSVATLKIGDEFSFIPDSSDLVTPIIRHTSCSGEQTYTHSKVITLLEHLLSFQKQGNQWSTSNDVNVDTMVNELKKLGFYVNPNGKNMETGV